MSSFGDGDDGDGDHRPQYLCHQCNQHFSLSPDDIVCPNCNGDSFEELPTIPVQGIQNSSLSNITSQIAALLNGAGGFGGTCNISMKIGPTPIIRDGQQIGVTHPASATVNLPVSDFTNANIEQLMSQFLLNSLLFPGGVPPPSASESGGNENSDSESETIDEEDLD